MTAYIASSRHPLYFDSRRWPRRPARRASTPARTCSLKHGLLAGAASMRHDEYLTSTGLRVLHAQQYQGALQVYRSERVVEIRGSSSRITPLLHRVPLDLALQPTVGAQDALAAALAFLKKRRALAPGVRTVIVRQTQFRHLADAPTVVELRYGLASPARLHLEVFPQPAGRAELAWVVDLALKSGLRVEAVVAARGRPKVLFLAQTNTCAFTADWVPVPGTIARGDVFPIPPLATPDGIPGSASYWSSETAVAEGPNVRCLSGAPPTTDLRGALPVDNVFVWCNLLHDLFTAFGFDSAHGAFDNDDRLEVKRLRSSSVKAGEYDNQLDGSSPLMLLYGTPYQGGVHATQDPGIIVHEYLHGVTSRLVGGATCLYPFVGEEALGLSEGFSDYFALTLLNHVDRARNGPGAISAIGGNFRPGGLRDYASFRDTWTGRSRGQYHTGMIWCAALLEAHERLAASPRTADEVDAFLWQTCVDCFKTLAPASPGTQNLTLARARDALVAAAGDLAARHPAFRAFEDAPRTLTRVLGTWGI